VKVTPNPDQLLLRTERVGANVRVGVEGELDIATLPELRDAVAAARDEALEHLVLDLRAVTFLDSMSIEFLLQLHTSMAETDAELVVVRGSHAVNRLFEIMELHRVLTIVDEPPAYVTPSGA
jgi:anti-sigma B factor antagonist